MKAIIRSASVRRMIGPKGDSNPETTRSGLLGLTPFSPAFARQKNSDLKSAELVAAAHAGSFSSALAKEIGRKSLFGGKILTSSAVTLDRVASGWAIAKIHLSVVARLPKVTQGRFIEATVQAKANCLVSRVLRATISMNAKLEK